MAQHLVTTPRALSEAFTYRQLDYYVRKGYLRPLGGHGSGNRRHWPESEVRIALRMAALVREGYIASAAARLARQEVSAA